VDGALTALLPKIEEVFQKCLFFPKSIGKRKKVRTMGTAVQAPATLKIVGKKIEKC